MSEPAPHADEPAVAEHLYQALEERPGRYDLFQAMRRIEAAHPQWPRLGDALRPGDEPLRLAGEPALNFAPGAISRLERPANRVPRLVQRVLGLFGPNGGLPIHLTEYARERVMHHGDRTFAAFADMLLHRFGLFFYRAWARANPLAGMDRPSDAPVVRQVGALMGLVEPSLRERDALGDYAKFYFAGRLARSVRDADGLEAWVRLRFGVAVQVQQFCGHWMPLERDERTRLRRHGAQALGRGATLGASVWDVQHKFRIHIGPLDWESFLRFLPGGQDLDALQALVRQYVGFEFVWDLQLLLRGPMVPAWPLGRQREVGQLGRTAWMNRPAARTQASPLVMNVESIRRAALQPSLAARNH